MPVPADRTERTRRAAVGKQGWKTASRAPGRDDGSGAGRGAAEFDRHARPGHGFVAGSGFPRRGRPRSATTVIDHATVDGPLFPIEIGDRGEGYLRLERRSAGTVSFERTDVKPVHRENVVERVDDRREEALPRRANIFSRQQGTGFEQPVIGPGIVIGLSENIALRPHRHLHCEVGLAVRHGDEKMEVDVAAPMMNGGSSMPRQYPMLDLTFPAFCSGDCAWNPGSRRILARGCQQCRSTTDAGGGRADRPKSMSSDVRRLS